MEAVELTGWPERGDHLEGQPYEVLPVHIHQQLGLACLWEATLLTGICEGSNSLSSCRSSM